MPIFRPFSGEAWLDTIRGIMITYLADLLRRFGRGSLLLRFSLLSLAVLACIAAGLVWVLQQQVQHNALEQQANEVAVVFDGTMARYLKPADMTVTAGKARRSHWTWLAGALLKADKHLIGVKVWDRNGWIIYCNNPRLIGTKVPMDANLQTAMTGHRAMAVSTLDIPASAHHAARQVRVLDTYVPIYGWGKVIGAYEAFSDLASLQPQMDEGRRTIWLTVGLGFLLLYASLFAIVRRASRRLVQQMRAITALEVQAREAETLREVDRLKDEFIGDVSHELRRPLASIKGYTGSLLLPDTRWKLETQREFLQVIDEEADHLALLIDNLLDLARLGSGSLPLSRELVHLPALTEQVVRRIRAQSQLPSHPYELHFPERFPVVDADPERMKQLLLNLLENAAKYSPPRTPIVVAGCIEGERVAMSVTDRGPGLTPEHASHVFDKFYRVDSGLTRATEGTGLGLAICRGVVQAHGGEITVSSSPGRGSTFTFRLPALMEVAPMPAPLARRHPAGVPGGAPILGGERS
jgi:signal transduction histidine kinase